MEYPECPYCGAIQDGHKPAESTIENVTCHSCEKRFELRIVVTRLYHATRID